MIAPPERSYLCPSMVRVNSDRCTTERLHFMAARWHSADQKIRFNDSITNHLAVLLSIHRCNPFWTVQVPKLEALALYRQTTTRCPFRTHRRARLFTRHSALIAHRLSHTQSAVAVYIPTCNNPKLLAVTLSSPSSSSK